MANGEWWRDLFDADYVEMWSAAGVFDRTAEQVEGIVGLLDDLPPGGRILDIPCGFGRIAGPLHQRGYDVVGVDLSEVQLRLAEERHPGPHYLRGDMREPPAGPFDVVLNIFTSFGYFSQRDEDLRALRSWHDVLRPGGILVMLVGHRDRVVWREAERRLADPSAAEPVGPIREETEIDWVEGIRTATAIQGERRKTFRVRLYTVTELVRACRDVGFSTIDAFGGFDRRPVTPETPLVLRAVR